MNRKDASETRSKLESTDSFQPTPVGQTITTPYILRPEITVYPEIDSVTSGSDYLIRVAIKITGVLKPTSPVVQQESESDRLPLTSTPGKRKLRWLGNHTNQHLEMKKYGTMHDFDVACFNMLGSPVEYMITPNWPVCV